MDRPRFGIRHVTVVPTNYEPPTDTRTATEATGEDTDGSAVVPSEG
jgi:hypothetical protein